MIHRGAPSAFSTSMLYSIRCGLTKSADWLRLLKDVIYNGEVIGLAGFSKDSCKEYRKLHPLLKEKS